MGGGLAYGALGYSHHAVQDYALMRVLPNMLIAAPGDPLEVRACLRYLVKHPQPSYLRLGKVGEPSFHTEVPAVTPGLWLKLREGSTESAALTTGATLTDVMAWTEGRIDSPSVYSCPLWGMAFKDCQMEQASRHRNLVTVEDHLRDAGFGSWLGEALASMPDAPTLRSLALDSGVCGVVGSQRTLNQIGGLDRKRFDELLER